MTTRKQAPFSSREALYIAGGIVGLLVVCSTILIALGKPVDSLKDMAQIVALPLLSVLGAAIYSKVAQMTDQVNGRMTQLIDHAQNSVPLDKVDKVEKSS